MNNGARWGKASSGQSAEPPAPEPVAIDKRFVKLVPDLSPELVSKFVWFYGEVLQVQKTIPILNTPNLKNIEVTQFADSILASRLVFKNLVAKAPLYDVGSGSGFPGLVFAALYPSINVVIIDSDKRKVDFCKHGANGLGLKNVTTQVGGLEDLVKLNVSNAVVRGGGPLTKVMLAWRKGIVKGGRLFHLKGDGWAVELSQVPSQLFSSWSPSLVGQYRLPETPLDMAVVQTEKIGD
jgi:16S rRNA (guanine527-N7)-methyltransferase